MGIKRGPVAVVTGATAGIGRAIANRLAGEGQRVVIVSRHRDQAIETAAQIAETTGSSTLGIAADMGSGAAIESAMGQIMERFERVDVLVNNAGSSHFGGILDLDLAAWRADYAVKLLGSVTAIRCVLPGMIAQQSGTIVNIAGIGGREAEPLHMIGGSINAALVHLTKTVAIQVAGQGIRVNALSPGFILTDRIVSAARTMGAADGRTAEKWLADQAAAAPMGRLGEPAEIANAVAFLVSPAASFVNGAHLVVDGTITRAVA